MISLLLRAYHALLFWWKNTDMDFENPDKRGW